MTTDTIDAPPDMGSLVLHVENDVGGTDEMTVLEVGTERAALEDDLVDARRVIDRVNRLDDALRLALPVGETLYLPGDRALTLVEAEGNRAVVPGVFAIVRDRLVKMGLATVEDAPPPEPIYKHGGVRALTTPEATAALNAAGIEGLIARKPGAKSLVLSTGVTAPTEEG